MLRKMRKYAPYLFVLLAAGCFGSSGPGVSGVVQFEDGQPLTVGNLMFDNGKYSDFAVIDDKGNFRVENGLPEGNYKVSIQGDAAGTYSSPEPRVNSRYLSPQSTDLEIVVPSTTGPYKLVVEKPGKTQARPRR